MIIESNMPPKTQVIRYDDELRRKTEIVELAERFYIACLPQGDESLGFRFKSCLNLAEEVITEKEKYLKGELT